MSIHSYVFEIFVILSLCYKISYCSYCDLELSKQEVCAIEKDVSEEQTSACYYESLNIKTSLECKLQRPDMFKEDSCKGIGCIIARLIMTPFNISGQTDFFDSISSSTLHWSVTNLEYEVFEDKGGLLNISFAEKEQSKEITLLINNIEEDAVYHICVREFVEETLFRKKPRFIERLCCGITHLKGEEENKSFFIQLMLIAFSVVFLIIISVINWKCPKFKSGSKIEDLDTKIIIELEKTLNEMFPTAESEEPGEEERPDSTGGMPRPTSQISIVYENDDKGAEDGERRPDELDRISLKTDITTHSNAYNRLSKDKYKRRQSGINGEIKLNVDGRRLSIMPIDPNSRLQIGGAPRKSISEINYGGRRFTIMQSTDDLNDISGEDKTKEKLNKRRQTKLLQADFFEGHHFTKKDGKKEDRKIRFRVEDDKWEEVDVNKLKQEKRRRGSMHPYAKAYKLDISDEDSDIYEM